MYAKIIALYKSDSKINVIFRNSNQCHLRKVLIWKTAMQDTFSFSFSVTLYNFL